MYISDLELAKAQHGDIRHGFCMIFDKKPDIDFITMEQHVNSIIGRDLPVTYLDDSHITIGQSVHRCRGPRTHVSHTGEIKGFRLLHSFVHDAFNNAYLLVGFVGEDSDRRIADLERKLPT